MKTKLICLLLCLSTPLLAPAVSHAQTPTNNEGISLQVSPLPIDLVTKPGTSVSTPLRVRNAGSKTEKLQVSLLKVTEDNNGLVHLSKPGANDAFTQWVSFSRTVFNAPPGEWQTINMTVDVPSSAAFGYYWAVEYSRADTEQAQAGKAVARGAVATFILLNADAPGAIRQAQVTSFSSDKKTYEFLPATFSVKVKNTGNVHVAPHGNIFISKGGKQVAAIPVNLAGGNVLPSSSRYYSASWDNGFPVYIAGPDNKGKAKTSLKWDLSKANRLRYGHYSAHLVMIYDDGTRDVPMEATVSFWVIPWRVILYALLIIIGPALAVYLIMRWRFNKRLQKENKKTSNGK